MFYYYAYIENNICVDIERTKRQKTDLTGYIEVTQAEYDAYINDEVDSTYYIIGKIWNGSEWVLPTKFYYAVLNNKGIVVDFLVSDSEVSGQNYISITKDEYESKVYLHMKWDVTLDKFVEVPFVEYADTDTTKVSVDNTNTSLQTFLEKLQECIAKGTVTADDILKSLDSVAKQSDLVNIASKTDLQAVATKTDLQPLVTKADMQSVASKNDLQTFVTKADLQVLRNEIIASLPTGNSVIKSIQRGRISPSDEGEPCIFDTPVNPDKCIVLIDGNKVVGGASEEYSVEPHLYELTSTSVTFNTTISNTRERGAYSWQVVEFY